MRGEEPIQLATQRVTNRCSGAQAVLRLDFGVWAIAMNASMSAMNAMHAMNRPAGRPLTTVMWQPTVGTTRQTIETAWPTSGKASSMPGNTRWGNVSSGWTQRQAHLIGTRHDLAQQSERMLRHTTEELDRSQEAIERSRRALERSRERLGREASAEQRQQAEINREIRSALTSDA